MFKDPEILMLRKIVCIDLVIPKAPNPTLIYLNGGLLWEKSCKTQCGQKEKRKQKPKTTATKTKHGIYFSTFNFSLVVCIALAKETLANIMQIRA